MDPKTQELLAKVGAYLKAQGFAKEHFTGPPQVQQSPRPDAKPGPYLTVLPPEAEKQYQRWAVERGIDPYPEPSADYDMRGFWLDAQHGKASAEKSAFDGQMHYPDTHKTPYHKTFSDESKFALPGAPRWINDRLIDSSGRVVADESNYQGKPLPTPPDPYTVDRQGPPQTREAIRASMPQTNNAENIEKVDKFIGGMKTSPQDRGMPAAPAPEAVPWQGPVQPGQQQPGQPLTPAPGYIPGTDRNTLHAPSGGQQSFLNSTPTGQQGRKPTPEEFAQWAGMTPDDNFKHFYNHLSQAS